MAKGSEQKYGGWESKHCSGCGKRIRLSDKTSMFCSHSKLGVFTVCGDCSWPDVVAKLSAEAASTLQA